MSGNRREVVHVEHIEVRKSSASPTTYLPSRVLRRKKYYIQATIALIPHTSRNELVLKLERSDTTARDQARHQISLNEEEISELFDYVQAASVLRDQPPGSYALLRLAKPEENDEATQTAATLVDLLGNPELASALRHPEIAQLLAESMNDVIRLAALRTATNRLEALLESGEVLEARYQDWLETYTWALGNMYVRRENVRRISAADDVDILVESALNGLRDVYELKRPDMAVLQYDKEHRSYYWSHHVTKAIGQCHRYLDVLHDKLRSGLDDHPEIVSYHPRAAVIIGRSNTWSKKELHALHGLNARLHGIAVMTYDQLLAQCRALLTQVDS